LIILSDIIYTIGTLLSLSSDSYSFIIARFIVGLAVGLNNSVILLYIREISPENLSKKTVYLHNATLNFGIIVGLIMNLGIKDITSNF
jgi:MFS family permease